MHFDLWRFWPGLRKQPQAKADPLPAVWQQFLAKTYRHYARLPSDVQPAFDRATQFFLTHKKITGIEMEATDDLKVLVAASAVTLSFRWPGYEWRQLGEVLLYPDSFDQDYRFGRPERAGQVDHWGTVILSAPELRRSFSSAKDCDHVGVHEFAHVLDLHTSNFNGIPPGLSLEQTRRWVEIQQTELELLRTGRSILHPYGMTNELEFFAVSVDTFFQKPIAMEHQHPNLYRFLSTYFDQDPAGWERDKASRDAATTARAV